jgi:hypothetical protein
VEALAGYHVWRRFSGDRPDLKVAVLEDASAIGLPCLLLIANLSSAVVLLLQGLTNFIRDPRPIALKFNESLGYRHA